jgi:hypothetical protein
VIAQKSRPAKAANPNENSSHATMYPRKIRLSDTAEAYIAGLAVDLMLAEVELHQLPPCLLELWEYGLQTGRQSRQAEVDQLQSDCDRLYGHAARGTFKVPLRSQGRTFAELEAIRNAGAK